MSVTPSTLRRALVSRGTTARQIALARCPSLVSFSSLKVVSREQPAFLQQTNLLPVGMRKPLPQATSMRCTTSAAPTKPAQVCARTCKKAVHWYDDAALRGNQEAKAALYRLGERSSSTPPKSLFRNRQPSPSLAVKQQGEYVMAKRKPSAFERLRNGKLPRNRKQRRAVGAFAFTSRTRSHPLCRPVVSLLFSFAARC